MKLFRKTGDAPRYYGGDGTIHQTSRIDVQTHDGKVVAVWWFRCQMLPFHQSEVRDAEKGLASCSIVGVEVVDHGGPVMHIDSTEELEFGVKDMPVRIEEET